MRQTKVGDEAANFTGPVHVEPAIRCRVFTRTSLARDDMKNFKDSIVNFIKEEDGPTAVEYAVMLALIAVACLTAVTGVGTAAKGKFEEVGTAISN